jgi:hypothetical protein
VPLLRVPVAAAVVWILGGTAAWAQGGPPYFTNDPETPGDRRWEINIGYIPIVDTTHSTAHAPDLDINYGVGDRIQLTFEVAWIGDKEPPELTKYGLGPDVVGVKWRFHGDEPHLSMSVFPQLQINNPTRSVARGIAERGASLILPVELATHVGAIALNGEAGFVVNQSESNGWLAGIVVGRGKQIKLHKASIELDGEFYISGEEVITQETIDAGVRVELHGPFVLLAMAGRSLHHPRGSFVGYFGVQLLLPVKR